MTRSLHGQGIRFWMRGLVSFLLIGAVLILSTVNFSWAPTQAAVPSTLNIREWQVPTGNAGPGAISVDSTGRVWFAENLTGKLGMLDPVANSIYEWNLPNGGTQAFVNSRNIFAVGSLTFTGGYFRTYFAEYGKDRISYLETTAPTPTVTTTVTSTTTTFTSTTTTNSLNRLTEWQIPTGSRPASIFVDDQGNMWFTESGRDAIGELTAEGFTTSQFIEWTLPGANPSAGKCAALCLWGIYVQKIPSTSDYYVWFTERTGGPNDVGEVGRLQLSNNMLTTWDLSTVSNGVIYQPFDIAVDPAGNAYISNYLGNKISMLGNSGIYQEYAVGTANSKPLAVTSDPNRNLLWFLEYAGNNLAFLNYTTPGSGLTLSASQCVIPSTITVTTSFTASRTTYTTTTNVNPAVQTCGGNAFENGAVSTTTTPILVGTPNVSNQNPSIRPLGSAQGPVNGISEYALPSSNSRPYSLTLDSYDNLWITESDNSANRIAEIIPPADFNIQLTSQSQLAVAQGSVVTYSFSISPVSGPQSQVLLSVSAPSGLTANFNPSSGTPPFQSTLTITTTTSTPPSTYDIGITATSNTETHSLNIALTVLSTSLISSTASLITSQSSVTTTSATPTVTVTLATTIYSISQTAVGPISTYVQVSSNSTISSLGFDSSRRLLNFTATGPPGTIGQTEVVIAESLIDGAPTVIVDNGRTMLLSLIITSNSTHYRMLFTYPHSTHTITVGGSNTIPEFPTSLPVLTITLLFITLGVRIKRRLRASHFPHVPG